MSIICIHLILPETLCMKGLSTYNQGKREEGREIAKRGLSLELTSHVTWHVNALIHRADREWVEALKCYSQAHKIEPVRLKST